MTRIVYVNNAGQLETAGPDGFDHRQLTANSCRYQFPAWSPDGQAIAAIGSDIDQEDDAFLDVYELDNQDLVSRTVYQDRTSPPFYLYWSPRNNQITFLVSHPRSGIALRVVDIEGGPSRSLAVGQPLFWVWQSDGAQLLVHTGGSEVDSQLLFIDPDSGRQEQNLTAPGYFQTPGLSHKGDYCAYASSSDEGLTSVVVEEIRSRRRHKIDHQGAAALSWSPTDPLLAFTSPLHHTNHFYGPLRIVNARSDEVLFLIEEVVFAHFWSPNGRYIAYVTLTPRGESRQTSQMIGEGYARGRRMPSQDDREVWFNLKVVDVRSGRSRLLSPFRPSPYFTNQFMPFFDQYQLSHPIWSPESDALVIPARIAGQDHVVVVPINGLPPILIGQGSMPSWCPK